MEVQNLGSEHSAPPTTVAMLGAWKEGGSRIKTGFPTYKEGRVFRGTLEKLQTQVELDSTYI